MPATKPNSTDLVAYLPRYIVHTVQAHNKEAIIPTFTPYNSLDIKYTMKTKSRLHVTNGRRNAPGVLPKIEIDKLAR